MKLLISVLFIINFIGCKGQTNLLLDKEVILDWSEYPVYSMIIDESAENQWKNEFKYLDSIELSWITYNSDGLKINTAQNCNAFLYQKDTLQYEGCLIAEDAYQYYQYSREYQEILDSAIKNVPVSPSLIAINLQHISKVVTSSHGNI
ncbi:MAG: hypothetical protein IPJ13_20715 [Saprospiraceae bacterium]|nr:hypothetical protein [Saprospiraceae bacterium]